MQYFPSKVQMTQQGRKPPLIAMRQVSIGLCAEFHKQAHPCLYELVVTSSTINEIGSTYNMNPCWLRKYQFSYSAQYYCTSVTRVRATTEVSQVVILERSFYILCQCQFHVERQRWPQWPFQLGKTSSIMRQTVSIEKLHKTI